MEVLRRHAAGVYGWSRFQAARGYDFNATVLLGGPDDPVLLVDPVAPTEGELEALYALDERFVIVLTNADHERAAAELRETLVAPVWAPAPDVPALKLAGARPYDHGHVFPGGWTAHLLKAQKTPGEAALHHPERRLLVVGDAVIADPVTGLRLPPPKAVPDREAALAGLRPLLALDFDGLLPGDGFVLPSGGKAALERFLGG